MTKPVQPLRIYVAGPYTKGDQAVNVRNAIFAGNYCRLLGHIPFIPHLSMIWQMLTPHDDVNFWYEYDMECLKVCDAVLLIEGDSVGAENEVAWAEEHGLKVYHNVFEIPRVPKTP